MIAHRGACGYVPEHTLAAYALAALQGADFVEPDLVMTRDGHLIARHDNVLDLTTDVASRPEFADRRTARSVDGLPAAEGWYSEDFTLEEIKRLRAIERIPDIRPASARFDRQFRIPTLQEIIDLVKGLEKAVGREVGIYPETKHPTYFAALGLAMEEPLVEILHRNGYVDPGARVFIQSFETGSLKKLRAMTRIPLVQLLWLSGGPYDMEAAGGTLTFDEMAGRRGLDEIASYADGVGPEKYHFVIPLDGDGNLDAGNATPFVVEAHAAGLLVHPYTFRAENAFLPKNLRSSEDPADLGDYRKEVEIFLSSGIDGYFTDHPHPGASRVGPKLI